MAEGIRGEMSKAVLSANNHRAGQEAGQTTAKGDAQLRARHRTYAFFPEASREIQGRKPYCRAFLYTLNTLNTN